MFFSHLQKETIICQNYNLFKIVVENREDEKDRNLEIYLVLREAKGDGVVEKSSHGWCGAMLENCKQRIIFVFSLQLEIGTTVLENDLHNLPYKS